MALVHTSNVPDSGVTLHTYDNIDTADTTPVVIVPGGTEPLVGAIQVVGTFGGSSVTLQGSNDKTNWIDIKDRDGTLIATTAAGGAEFSTSYLYLRPLVTGGTSDDLDIFIVLRG